jgi:DnaK suppressor protein
MVQDTGLQQRRMTGIHYRRRLAEELETLVRSALAAEAAAHRTRIALRAQSMAGRIQEATAIKAAARRSAMRQEQLMQAIGRLDDGTYGYCSGCSGLIEEERLNLDPCNTLCASCSRLRLCVLVQALEIK